MKKFLQSMLVCPACQGEFTWEIKSQTDERIEEATATCTHCITAYPISEGIGIFLSSLREFKDKSEA